MECKIKFADKKLKQAFEELKYSDKNFHNELEKALGRISENAFCGRNVKKKLIPKEIIRKYNVNNLWIYNLRKGWRLLYTIGSEEVEVIAVILGWMRHKDYERLFKF